MFNKLLANLPFNPSLAAQVAFYGKRLKAESSIRRLGFVFVGLALVVQVFAVVSPPQPSLASSNNDLINGGFGNAEQAALHCLNSTGEDYNTILTYYGIRCENVRDAATVTLRSTDYNRQLLSMGRLDYPIAGEQPVNIPGANDGRPLYLRYLWGWDTNGSSSYQALSGTTSAGLHFFILFNCGNLVFIGIPPHEAPKCPYNNALPADSPQCFQPCPYNSGIPATSPSCFQPCKYNPNIPATSPQCVAVCPYNKSLPANSPKCFPPCQYNPNIPSTSPSCFQPCKYNKNIPANSKECFQPCKYNSSVPSNSPSCKPCEASLSSQDTTACLELHKIAKNLTQNIANANGTQAHAGDTIEYTLSAFNSGSGTVKKFVMQENISDILDYADVVDLHGGTMDSNKVVSWPAVDIKAKQTITHVITVHVKNPIPQTPVSASDPGHFDLKMTNVYGDTVVITVPGSVPKVIETVATTTLPNTGPGSSLIIAFSLTLLVGYFLARSRLLTKEASLVRIEYGQSGGSL